MGVLYLLTYVYPTFVATEKAGLPPLRATLIY